MGKEIIWTRPAVESLYQIHEYILKISKSLIIADSVVLQIQNSTRILSNHIQIYLLDPNKLHNDGSYHAYEVYRYRITYKVSTDQIYILSVIHSSRKPTKY